jgi:ABC-type bacteriocin/lantibiotic exporter with double-glycine peptidase domain
MIKMFFLRFLFFSLSAFALLDDCRADIKQLNYNLFVAGVPSVQFDFYVVKQRKMNWCWAASVQMVLNYHGLFVKQEEIVQRIYGDQVDLSAQPSQILAALSGWAPDTRGSYSAIQASPYTINGSQIVQDLAYKWPLIAGLSYPDGRGHAVVLTAIVYSVDQFNNPIFQKVVIRDPWPENPSKQELSWTEFQQRLSFLSHVYVQRH